jgi:hypothetical protein
MIGILRIALVIAVALGVVAASVFGAKDSRILTAPPERELGVFLKRIGINQFATATTVLSDKLERRITADSLRALHDGITRQIGEIRDEETERRWIRGDSALAGGKLIGKRQTLEFDISLRRERGVWRITDLAPIERSLSAP